MPMIKKPAPERGVSRNRLVPRTPSLTRIATYLVFMAVATCLCEGYAGISTASDEEERLLVDIFRDYNNLVRPVKTVNETPIVVEFGMAMILLINVDEKNQIMQTNVWLTLKWPDYQVRWNPLDYGRITTIRVPPDKVWLPDIVLFNNADGKYEVSFHSNVVVEYTGSMLWVPPAIYKSSCTINVEYFPFDEQTCRLVFGSWTYNSKEVQLDWYNGKDQVELNDYSFSGIWDIMEVPGALEQDRSRITFSIRIRRKTLFYTVILIIPTILMAFLSMMVFYLPADASEKITLAISILLALVVFLLLVSKILPPTSTTIPLMAKYLLLTFVMNIVTILVTVIIINIYFRGPTTHRMPWWSRALFLETLPRFLLMKRPRRIPLLLRTYGEDKRRVYEENQRATATTESSSNDAQPPPRPPPSGRHHQGRASTGTAGEHSPWSEGDRISGGDPVLYQSGNGSRNRHTDSEHNDNQDPISRPPHHHHHPPPHRHHHPNCRLSSDNLQRTTSFVQMEGNEANEEEDIDPSRVRYLAGRRRRGGADDDIDPLDAISSSRPNAATLAPMTETRQIERRQRLEERFGEDAYRAIEALEYITEHLKQLDDYKKVRDDWKYAAMVIDRLLLYVFFGVTAGGTLGILLSAPNVFDYVDQAAVIERIKAKYPSF